MEPAPVINRFDRASDGFVRYRHDATDPFSLGDDDLMAGFEDHLGVLWFGTRTGGVSAYDHATQAFTRYQYDPADLVHSPSKGPVVAIAEGRKDESDEKQIFIAVSGSRSGAVDALNRSEGVLPRLLRLL